MGLMICIEAAAVLQAVCDAAPIKIWETTTAITVGNWEFFNWNTQTDTAVVSFPTVQTLATQKAATAVAAVPATTKSFFANTLIQGVADVISDIRSVSSSSSAGTASTSS